jgi:hypothetical protein
MHNFFDSILEKSCIKISLYLKIKILIDKISLINVNEINAYFK